ncbi:nucleoside triphosphate pyrophosphohydrolase [Rhabdaerophilum sp. SD176]|uniref:nucleoside triphosphate pyrophosphohydrolase n=1 Tax=Rhabdaerophilum sp. SD176 TaxID=2983548 RepID=UPI0024DF8BBA|nr:nucleoside triphosphate pyrophosphohydrolase [Rhabdaerophilum sp. SD176]
MNPSRNIEGLLAIMAALRDRQTGCPWDIEQDFASIAPYTIEEAYEVADAIARNDMVDLCDELGDLLLQVVFHARMAEEAGHFAFADVVEAITRKLIRRHPHVFGDRSAGNPGLVKALWEAIKAEERAEKQARKAAAGRGSGAPEVSLLDDVPRVMPALTRAVKLQKKAGTVGFDWNDPRAVLAKLREEIAEVEEALDQGDKAHLQEEIGDMLFVIANLARHADIEPEAALGDANAKFCRRFRHIEAGLAARGSSLAEASLEEMDALWHEAKMLERPPGGAV